MQYDLMNDMNLTNGQYSGLHTVSSWASLLDIIDGYIIEKWVGLKVATLVCCLVVAVSSIFYILAGFIQSFWLMTLSRLIFGAFFRHRYSVNTAAANYLSSLYLFTACFLSPVVGYAIDITGRNLIYFTGVILFGFAAHIMFGITSINPIVPVVFLGISTALLSSVLGMLKYMVDDDQYAVAFGITQTGCQFSTGGGSLVAGYIADFYGYESLEIYYLITLICASVLVSIMWYLDFILDKPISMSAAERILRMDDGVNFKITNEQSTPPIERAAQSMSRK